MATNHAASGHADRVVSTELKAFLPRAMMPPRGSATANSSTVERKSGTLAEKSADHDEETEARSERLR
jgi:hypothetical protein